MIADFDSTIKNLMKISPAVNEYIYAANYLKTVDSEDAVTEEMLLNNSYAIIQSDLEAIGIFLHVPLADILENFYDAYSLAWLLDLLNPINFIKTITTLISFENFIEKLNDISDNEYIVHVLINLIDLSKDEDTNHYATFLKDRIYSSDIFSNKYMESLTDIYDRFFSIEDEAINIEAFKKFIEFYNDAKNKAFINIDTLKEANLISSEKSMKYYFETFYLKGILNNSSILDPISLWYLHENNISDLTIVTEENKNTIKSDWINAFKIYENTDNLHSAYYEINNLLPSSTDIILIMVIVMFIEEKLSIRSLAEEYNKLHKLLEKSNKEDNLILLKNAWDTLLYTIK